MSIPILTNIKKHLNRVAIEDSKGIYTYEILLEKAQQIAFYLLQNSRDLKGERIAFLVSPSFEYVAIQWGIWLAGGIAVPLCNKHPLKSMAYVLEDSQANLVIIDQEISSELLDYAAQNAINNICLEALLTQENKAVPLPSIPLDRSASILYTSGTTSLPKGVLSTHANIDFQITTLVKAWAWQKEDAIINVLPLHHVHGIINIMSCAMYSGARCIFLPKFNVEQLWERLCRGDVNLFMAVPTIYHKLIQDWKAQDKEEQRRRHQVLSSFRLMVSGSAALPIDVLNTWETISGQRLLERYGMTEIGMALSNPYKGERRAAHVGWPLPGVEVRLQHDDGQFNRVKTAGEIQVKGPNVFKAYWNKERATLEAFTEDGWFKTGDIAQINEDNYIQILGRNTVDIIKSGGYKISALQIENVLRQYPLIKDCAVVGVPSEEWGESIAASIVLEDVNQLIDWKVLHLWLVQELPRYMIPRDFIIQDDLPRNILGKVTKKAVKALFN